MNELNFFKATSYPDVFFLIIAIPLLLLIPTAFLYMKYLRLEFFKTVFISIFALLCGIAIATCRPYIIPYNFVGIHGFITILSSELFALFLIPFAFNLYNKWIGDGLTEEEKKPGIEGVRAWLSTGNILCCFGIALFGFMGFTQSFVNLLMVTLCALLAYPLFNNYSQNTVPDHPVLYDDLSKEREKILSLLEEGKITAEESAELLNALAASSYPPRQE